MPSLFASAIAKAEGFGVPGAVPTRNNNPGDLRGWPGVPKDSSGYSVFPAPAAGWAALETQLATIAAGASAYYSPDMTIAQMGVIWAAGDPAWGRNVAAYLGVPTSAMIGQFLGAATLTAPSSPAPPIVADGAGDFALTNQSGASADLVPSTGIPSWAFLLMGGLVLLFLSEEIFA